MQFLDWAISFDSVGFLLILLRALLLLAAHRHSTLKVKRLTPVQIPHRL